MSKLRKKRTPQEKFKIVMEGLRGDHGSIAALCNAYGITQTDFYRWRDILMEDGSRFFERGGVDRERQRLEDENHTFNELETALATWTKRYNEEFLHSTLGYESPIEYENWFYHATRREVPYLMS